ncbi:MAG: winged helix-turn-helix transcriptional regulator [Salinivirgaceae bacterium]|jgi:predicted ArsR family transcriptional regulator|nr:winged helix-turn-helix transcriptional regulator [Salinivirgaceae bacterium]
MNEVLQDKTNELILELLEKNEDMTFGSIVKDLGISAERGIQHMLQLRQKGLVKVSSQSKYALNL